MVLTAAPTTAFFESPDQMGIPHATMVQMQLEGIQSIADPQFISIVELNCQFTTVLKITSPPPPIRITI